MKFMNTTPFPGNAWENLSADNTAHLCAVVRVKYGFRPIDNTGHYELYLSPEQGSLLGEDQFYESPAADASFPGCVRYESDYCPYKARTDLIINGYAHAPDGQGQAFWEAGIKIDPTATQPAFFYAFAVYGKRYWFREYQKDTRLLKWRERPEQWGEWQLTEPEPVTRVALRYEQAFGGGYRCPPEHPDTPNRWLSFHEANPAGCGNLSPEDDTGSRYLAPSLLPQQMGKVMEAFKAYPLAGTGIIHRAWQPRLHFAGTYNQAWLDKQWPLPPEDFSAEHWQAAPPYLQYSGYLQGGETLRMRNLTQAHELVLFSLPKVQFGCLLETSRRSQRLFLNLDTLVIDVTEDEPSGWFVYASYRGMTPSPSSLKTVTAVMNLPEAWISRPIEAEEA